MKQVIFRIITLLLLFATFFVIFRFSAQTGQASSSVSKRVTTKFVNTFSYTKDLSQTTRDKLIKHGEPIVRKLAHFSIYTVVGIWIMMFMCTFHTHLRKKLGVSLMVGLLYAILDEYHQSFVPRKRSLCSRCSDWYRRCLFRNPHYFSDCIDLSSFEKRFLFRRKNLRKKKREVIKKEIKEKVFYLVVKYFFLDIIGKEKKKKLRRNFYAKKSSNTG